MFIPIHLNPLLPRTESQRGQEQQECQQEQQECQECREHFRPNLPLPSYSSQPAVGLPSWASWNIWSTSRPRPMSWLKTNCGDYIDCLLPFSTGGWVSIPVSGSSVGSFTSGTTSPATSEVTCVELGATWLTTESAMPGTESSFPSSIAVTITVSPRSSRCHVSYQCCPQSFGFFGEFSSFYPQQSHKHCSAVWRSPLGTSKVILE